MCDLYQEVIVPYTKQGGGNYLIERHKGEWLIIEPYIPFTCVLYKDKRKLKRAIYKRIKYVRKMIGSINDMYLLKD